MKFASKHLNTVLDYPSFRAAVMENLLAREEWKLEPSFLKVYEKGMVGKSLNDRKLFQDINQTYFQRESATLLDDFLVIEIPQTENSVYVMRFHLRALYEEYQKGGFQQVRAIVGQTFQSARNSIVNATLPKLSDYEKIAPQLILRPLNFDKNRAALSKAKAVYDLYGDIALVLYIELSYDGTNLNTSKVPLEMLEMWGKAREEVMKNALINSSILAPPRMYRSFADAYKPTYDRGAFMALNRKVPPLREFDVPTISTTRKLNGALAMFYPGVKERIAELYGGSYYVAFVGTDDVRLHKESSITPESVLEKLQNMNEVFPDEMLSNQVFLYRQDKKTLTPLVL